MSVVRFRIKGAYTKLLDGPAGVVDRILTFEDTQARFKTSYQAGSYDGKHRFYDGAKKTFPTGFLERIKRRLIKDGHTIKVQGKREDPGVRVDKHQLFGITLYPDQVEAANTLLRAGSGVLEAATRSGKTEVMIAMASALMERGLFGYMLVPRAGLLRQTVARFNERLDGVYEVGQLGAGVKKTGQITIATSQTMAKVLRGQISGPEYQVLREADFFFGDECHHGSARTWYDVFMMTPCRLRWGVSATPETGKEISDLRLEAAIGPIRVRRTAHDMAAMGRVAQPLIYFITDPNIFGRGFEVEKAIQWHGSRKKRYRPLPPKKSDRDFKKEWQQAHRQGIVQNNVYNRAVAELAEALLSAKCRVLVLSHRLPQLRSIQEKLMARRVRSRLVTGNTEYAAREDFKQLMQERGGFVMLASTVFDEGEDMPALNAVILAGGMGTKHRAKQPAAVQRVGRVLTGKGNVLVFDFGHLCNDYLIKNAEARLEAYVDQKWKVFNVDNFPRLLVQMRRQAGEITGASNGKAKGCKRRKPVMSR